MASGNAIGKKLSIFVIGLSKTPSCFKHKKNLPCKYKSQKKNWMDGQIFEAWVRKLDQKFRMKGKKSYSLLITVLHILLHHVQLIFLPPNTTSVLQPMDQCVIRSLKVHYRGRVVRRLCRALDKTKALSKISILRATVLAQTIVKCFRKAGITPEAQHVAISKNLLFKFKNIW